MLRGCGSERSPAKAAGRARCGRCATIGSGSRALVLWVATHCPQIGGPSAGGPHGGHRRRHHIVVRRPVPTVDRHAAFEQ